MNAPDKIDPETGEISSREMAAEFLLGELIKAASKRFKALAVPYMGLKEHEQTTLMREIDADIRRAVREAVDVIATDNRSLFRAACESVNFKPDGVKATLTMANTEGAHDLADYAGRVVLIVIEDGKRYLDVDTSEQVRGEDDQKALFDKSTQGTTT